MIQTIPPQQFSENLKRVNERIFQSAKNSGRRFEDITLIGVSKKKSIEAMQVAMKAGLTHFGENRVQEAREKYPHFKLPGITRHFIGHLQTNKVKYLPGLVDVIHSVDSTKLADIINQRFALIKTNIPVLVEVNISGEKNKKGVAPDEAGELAAYCQNLQFLSLRGLMTIGPLSQDKNIIRTAFRKMKVLLDSIHLSLEPNLVTPWLSMGMTGDFEIAVEEGATHLRIGTALFGERD